MSGLKPAKKYIIEAPKVITPQITVFLIWCEPETINGIDETLGNAIHHIAIVDKRFNNYECYINPLYDVQEVMDAVNAFLTTLE